ncbi:TetR/AcrR family transcriptional regulator [Microbacterium azadirachtae]|uniref:DNA-binding transcriptional regulator, AcrR family n=1 Tax=Microbacterium azadirachtae TaxID=582680 RepID=A0A1I6HSD2_9MICO|nr:TetR/AcrR family transcriptional regulator [Microbacterium azadirachtae]SFR57334.1 DNA-binding transcriptional regulator, AcrR family [Microbacterium azadirachtae]
MSTPAARRPLDRNRVVAAAIGLADEHGFDAISMRRVAERLEVTPMALYKHVARRSQLTDDMLDALLAGIPDAERGADWRTNVRARVMAARALLAAHPWARDAIETSPLATPRVLAHMDALMAAMFDGGLSADLVHHAMHALSTRMWGFTRDVMPTPQVPEDPEQRAKAMAGYARSYPAIVRMATTAPGAGEHCDDDAEFAFALDLLLEGVERRRLDGWTSGR